MYELPMYEESAILHAAQGVGCSHIPQSFETRPADFHKLGKETKSVRPFSYLHARLSTGVFCTAARH